MSTGPDCYNRARVSNRLKGGSFEDIEKRSIAMIIVTEKAAGEIRRVLAEQNMGEKVLRVAVAGGGCSGFQYRLGFDDAADAAKDHVTEQHGLKVAVDKKSDLYLDGTTVDFYDGLDKRGFTFNNPNVSKSCGCGSSFSV
jgi:iron-sulfur cluster assembly protein